MAVGAVVAEIAVVADVVVVGDDDGDGFDDVVVDVGGDDTHEAT